MEYLIILLVGLVFVLSVYSGYRRGFVKIMMSLVASLVAFLIALILVNPVSMVVKNSAMYENLKTNVSETICEGLKQNGYETADDLATGIKLPDVIAEKLAGSVVSELTSDFDELIQIDTETVVNTMVERVSSFILELVVFLCMFVLAYIVVRVIILVADLVTKLPGLNLINHTAGAILGGVQGILLVWVACLILTVFASSSLGSDILAIVSKNEVLSWIYSNNLLWNFLMTVIH